MKGQSRNAVGCVRIGIMGLLSVFLMGQVTSGPSVFVPKIPKGIEMLVGKDQFKYIRVEPVTKPERYVRIRPDGTVGLTYLKMDDGRFYDSRNLEIFDNLEAAAFVEDARTCDPNYAREAQRDCDKAAALYEKAINAAPKAKLNAPLAERVAQLYMFYEDPQKNIKPDHEKAAVWWKKCIGYTDKNQLLWAQANIGAGLSVETCMEIIAMNPNLVELPDWKYWPEPVSRSHVEMRAEEIERNKQSVDRVRCIAVKRLDGIIRNSNSKDKQAVEAIQQIPAMYRGTEVAKAAIAAMKELGIPEAGYTSLALVDHKPTAEQLKREQAVIEAADLLHWPIGNRLIAAPVVAKVFLSDTTHFAEKWKRTGGSVDISNESRVFSIVRLENMNFGMLEFKLDGSNNGNAAKGSLTMKMVAAGSAHAVQEWLIYESTQSSQDTDAIVKSFGKDKKVDKLGDVAFKDGGTLRFVRDNIAVCIQADGDYVKNLDDLAANIDMVILNTPELKYMPAARRILKPGELAKQKDADGNDVYSCKFTADPGNCKLIHIEATVDDKEVPILLNIGDNQNGRQISLGRLKGEAKIKITAINYNLMVDVMETTVAVPEVEKPAAN